MDFREPKSLEQRRKERAEESARRVFYKRKPRPLEIDPLFVTPHQHPRITFPRWTLVVIAVVLFLLMRPLLRLL